MELYNNLNKTDSIKNIGGLISKKFTNDKIDFVEDLDLLDFPSWEDFPLKNYWELGYSHGPLSNKKYLPMLTSRGCPYPCNFCVVPKTNERKWRSRTPKNVLKEIKFWQEKLGIKEFHFEDLNPTVNDKRTKELCNLIIKEKVIIEWKIVAGTKVESIKDDETIELLSRAGCKYISISPESGSKEVMQKIDKPFNYQHALKSVKKMNKEKIFTQACFVIGYPGEKKSDLIKTRKMIFDLSKRGIDEIAVFIITPIPGSNIYEQFKGFGSLSNLTFTPTWRSDYKQLYKERLIMYFIFLSTKFVFHPLKMLRQVINFFRKRFDTKMEMVPYKVLRIKSFENVLSEVTGNEVYGKIIELNIERSICEKINFGAVDPIKVLQNFEHDLAFDGRSNIQITDEIRSFDELSGDWIFAHEGGVDSVEIMKLIGDEFNEEEEIEVNVVSVVGKEKPEIEHKKDDLKQSRIGKIEADVTLQIDLNEDERKYS